MGTRTRADFADERGSDVTVRDFRRFVLTTPAFLAYPRLVPYAFPSSSAPRSSAFPAMSAFPIGTFPSYTCVSPQPATCFIRLPVFLRSAFLRVLRRVRVPHPHFPFIHLCFASTCDLFHTPSRLPPLRVPPRSPPCPRSPSALSLHTPVFLASTCGLFHTPSRLPPLRVPPRSPPCPRSPSALSRRRLRSPLRGTVSKSARLILRFAGQERLWDRWQILYNGLFPQPQDPADRAGSSPIGRQNDCDRQWTPRGTRSSR